MRGVLRARRGEAYERGRLRRGGEGRKGGRGNGGAELRKPTEAEHGVGFDAAAGTGGHTVADTARGLQGGAGGLGGLGRSGSDYAERLERLRALLFPRRGGRAYAGRKGSGSGAGRGERAAPA